MRHREIQLHHEPGLWPPSWPMGLTMLRLLLLPVFLFVLLTDANSEERRHHWLAVGIFAVMAITDKLDGYLARKLKQASHLGALLDPVADKIVVAMSVILLSFAWVAPRGYVIPRSVVMVVYGKDVIVVIGSLMLLSVVGKVRITPRLLGKFGTFLQLSLIIATLIGPDLDWLRPGLGWWVTRTLWYAVVTITAAACADYVVQGVRQWREAKNKKGLERQGV